MPFDVPSFLLGKQSGGGGGGVTVESKSISANGTYTAPTGKAYSPVTVNVANSYTAGDEGKVVSSGALVSQTAHAEVTENGSIDTTLNNSVVVNVQGSGSSPWTKLAEQDFTVSTTSTSATNVGTINLDVDELTTNDIVWVHIRDKAGKRASYYYGSDLINFSSANDANALICFRVNVNMYYHTTNKYGVYASDVSRYNKTVTIKAVYNQSFSYTIDGTYTVEVYKLTPPNGMVMFE